MTEDRRCVCGALYDEPWHLHRLIDVPEPLPEAPALVATNVDYCVTHDAVGHANLAYEGCRYRQLFYFENPMDEHTLFWSDEIAPRPQ